LVAGGSCLLGSLNLAEFVKNPFTNNATLDFDALESATKIAIIALNEVLMEGLSLHPLAIQRESVAKWRPIGLGTFGLSDALIKLGITYGSEKSIAVVDEIFRSMAFTSVITSLQLAKENSAFPECNAESIINSNFIKNLQLSEGIIEDIRTYGLYNSQLLTCPPTGTTATMLSVSTGVEPNFAFSFNRRTVSLNKEETVYKVDADIVTQYKQVTGNSELPEYFVASQDINPINRIKVQAAMQKYIDASISSTINLSENSTVEDIYNIYVEAWKHGLKGVTVWRDNCQRQGILTTKEEEKKEESIPVLKRGDIVKAGNDCIGLKRTLTTGCGSLHCTAYFEPNTGDLRECYLSKGSTGGCQNFMISLSRMISLSARGGIKVEDILDQLKSCGVCPSYAVRSATKRDTSKGSCCPVAVGEALKEMSEEMKTLVNTNQTSTIEIKQNDDKSEGAECPNCHEMTLVHVGGCTSCTSCGFSHCS
jgi:ribonucleoside-diphosphate reductase alpha chain